MKIMIISILSHYLIICWQISSLILIINCNNNNHDNDHNDNNDSTLDKPDLKNLINNIEYDQKYFRTILNNIAIPRNVNSKGHENVRQYIKNTLKNLDSRWHVEEDVFRTQTPAGQIKFKNIIATYIPRFGCIKSKTLSLKRTILACHYDSLKSSLVKGYDDMINSPTTTATSANTTIDEFIGATDAAVSCALMIYLAKSMNEYFDKYLLFNNNNNSNDSSLNAYNLINNRTIQLNTLQLIFFDGEEIIRSDISSTSNSRAKFKRNHGKSSKLLKSDSLFGSKHLADKWEKTMVKFNEEHAAKLKQLNNNLNTSVINQSNHKSIRYILCENDQLKLSMRRELLQNNLLTNNKKRIYEFASLKSEYFQTIDGIELFILFDLIGSTGNQRFYNTNLNTTKHFQKLIQIEKNYNQFNENKNSKIKNNNNNNNNNKTIRSMKLFQKKPAFMISFVRDDHLPFIIRNVPVLHLIPKPFPRTWHNMNDNVENLNFNSIERFAIIMEIFLINFFHLV